MKKQKKMWCAKLSKYGSIVPAPNNGSQKQHKSILSEIKNKINSRNYCFSVCSLLLTECIFCLFFAFIHSSSTLISPLKYVFKFPPQ